MNNVALQLPDGREVHRSRMHHTPRQGELIATTDACYYVVRRLTVTQIKGECTVVVVQPCWK